MTRMVIIILLAVALAAQAVMALDVADLLVRVGIDRAISRRHLSVPAAPQLWGHGKNIPSPKHRGQKLMGGAE